MASIVIWMNLLLLLLSSVVAFTASTALTPLLPVSTVTSLLLANLAATFYAVVYIRLLQIGSCKSYSAPILLLSVALPRCYAAVSSVLFRLLLS